MMMIIIIIYYDLINKFKTFNQTTLVSIWMKIIMSHKLVLP